LKYRKVFYYKDYFFSFFSKQKNDVQIKITWTLDFIRRNPIIPKKYFKHVKSTKGLYEIRIQHLNNIFRIFAFFDRGNLIIIINGFQKKTQKTPRSEIKKALRIKKEYENEKSQP
jgi:phage-related protein